MLLEKEILRFVELRLSQPKFSRSQTGDKKTYLLSESLDIWFPTRQAHILSIDIRAWAGLVRLRCWKIIINHTFRSSEPVLTNVT